MTMKGRNESKLDINQKAKSKFCLGAREIRAYENICFRSVSRWFAKEAEIAINMR